ncbi:MAG: DUF3623 family protein [Acidibrevibacterium sp.]|uniref:putative photosynthetic complex assembly protein PuhE n=1 Tax=Acidibrevibacterium fodinaquatile TaxID=1969806 RepID=UPI0023A7CF26|nr:putative photosynthetic complex assembly protein PuhE [Acidibrevibacterium fodinaquatile]MCA7120662.1 DUF3623 family protein [Acidibrevibacterium fodinaquatile]
MSHYVFPALYALFVWWFSTGVIIYLDGLPRATFRWSMIGATIVLAVSLYGLWASSKIVTLGGLYCAFTTGLLAWGWQEISFYMGFVTGPRREPCPENCHGWRHFIHAIETSLYHELAIIVFAVAVIALTWGAPNHVGAWTFMILWWMHQSAKLNVFLGVRNLNEEFLPEHLGFLKSFLTKKPMNLLFPFSVTISTVIAALLFEDAVGPGQSKFTAVGDVFLGTMMALAILEHWFLVLPLPAAALWHWGLASRKVAAKVEIEIVAGFLGAGKTTVLSRLLADAYPALRTVVLVNDFASVGVDGSLLAGRGADIVELPNGCICCSLRQDLARQLQETLARWAPQRVYIEPSGVADLASLISVLHQDRLRPLISAVHVRAVIDAGAFQYDFARMPRHFEAQMGLANDVLVNKCDLVAPAELRMIAATLAAINPGASIVPARFGMPSTHQGDADALAARGDDMASPPRSKLPARPEHMPAAKGARHHHEHEHTHERNENAEHEADHARDLDHGHEAALAGLTAWSATLGGVCHPLGLETVLTAVAAGKFGAVERVKGIARSGDGWVRFDVAGRRWRVAAYAPGNDEQARVIAIGRSVDEPGLAEAFRACVMSASM